MWIGIEIGGLAVAWIFRDQWGGINFKLRFWGNLLLPSAVVLIGFIAGLPDLCTQLIDGVRRFRDALKRQPHP
jgi:hypothetical protein